MNRTVDPSHQKMITGDPDDIETPTKDDLVCCPTQEDSTALYLQLQLPTASDTSSTSKPNKVKSRWLPPRRRRQAQVGPEAEDDTTTRKSTDLVVQHDQEGLMSPVVDSSTSKKISKVVGGNSPVSVASFIFQENDDSPKKDINGYSPTHSVEEKLLPENHPGDERRNPLPRPSLCLCRSNSWSGRTENRILDDDLLADLDGDDDDNRVFSRSMSFKIRNKGGGRKQNQKRDLSVSEHLVASSLMTTADSSTPDSKKRSTRSYKALLMKKTQKTFGKVVKGKFQFPLLPGNKKSTPLLAEEEEEEEEEEEGSDDVQPENEKNSSDTSTSVESPSLKNTDAPERSPQSLVNFIPRVRPHKRQSDPNMNRGLSMSEHIPRRCYSDSTQRKPYDISPKGKSSPRLQVNSEEVTPRACSAKSKKNVLRQKKDDLSQSEHIPPSSSKSLSKLKRFVCYQSFDDVSESSSWADLTLSLSPAVPIKVSTAKKMHLKALNLGTEEGAINSENEMDHSPLDETRKSDNRIDMNLKKGDPEEALNDVPLRRCSSNQEIGKIASSSKINRASPRKSPSLSRTSRMRSNLEEQLQNNKERQSDKSKRPNSPRVLLNKIPRSTRRSSNTKKEGKVLIGTFAPQMTPRQRRRRSVNNDVSNGGVDDAMINSPNASVGKEGQRRQRSSMDTTRNHDNGGEGKPPTSPSPSSSSRKRVERGRRTSLENGGGNDSSSNNRPSSRKDFRRTASRSTGREMVARKPRSFTSRGSSNSRSRSNPLAKRRSSQEPVDRSERQQSNESDKVCVKQQE